MPPAIKKDMQIRYGSIRLVCTGNTDGMCSVIPIYGTTSIGMSKLVPEEDLIRLREEGLALATLLSTNSISTEST